MEVKDNIVYLLKVKIYFYFEKKQSEKVEVFSSYEKAKNSGILFMKKEIENFYKDCNKTIDELISEHTLGYEFSIIEENLQYAENFTRELDFLEDIENILDLEPTHKEYVLDYKGNILNIGLEYKVKQEDPKFLSSIYITEKDLLKEAETKFKIGDIVKVTKRNENLAYYEYYNYSDLYVVKHIPKKNTNQKYIKNTYGLSEISSYDFAPGIYTKGFHEEQLEKYKGKIEENSPIDFLSKILKGDIKIDNKNWKKLK